MNLTIVVEKNEMVCTLLKEYLEKIVRQPVYLTGSHYFGTVRINSDYDFFTSWSMVVGGELEKAGFVKQKQNSSTYAANDKLTAEVYKRENVDVQLVNNVQLKQAVQEAIATNKHFRHLLSFLPKHLRYFVWEGVRTSLEKKSNEFNNSGWK